MPEREIGITRNFSQPQRHEHPKDAQEQARQLLNMATRGRGPQQDRRVTQRGKPEHGRIDDATPKACVPSKKVDDRQRWAPQGRRSLSAEQPCLPRARTLTRS